MKEVSMFGSSWPPETLDLRPNSSMYINCIHSLYISIYQPFYTCILYVYNSFLSSEAYILAPFPVYLLSLTRLIREEKIWASMAHLKCKRRNIWVQIGLQQCVRRRKRGIDQWMNNFFSKIHSFKGSGNDAEIKELS